MRPRPVLVAAFAAVVLAGCGSSNSGSGDCTAGKQVECTCAGGKLGVATCGDDGVVGVCDCEDGGSGGTGGSGGVGGGGGGSGGDGGAGGVGGTGGSEELAHLWVTHSIEFPRDESVGVDLDGDGTIDNALAKSLGLLSIVGGISFDQYVASGQLVQLHRLSATSLSDTPAATWELFAGEPVENPDFGGEGSFTVAAPITSFEGTIEGGHFEGGADTLLFTLPIFGGQAPLPLVKVRVVSAVSAAGCDGAAGGAVPAALVAAGVSLAINGVVEAEGCGPEVPCSDVVQGVLGLFDTNGDYRVTPEELTGNMLWAFAFTPDIDADGDGAKDALSVGWGFTCVGAVFELPIGG